jgi:hypothetical protein
MPEGKPDLTIIGIRSLPIITLYIDADACPVKQEIYRVAERHALKGVALKVFVVSNSPIAIPRDGIFGGPPDAKPGATFAGGPLVERGDRLERAPIRRLERNVI